MGQFRNLSVNTIGPSTTWNDRYHLYHQYFRND